MQFRERRDNTAQRRIKYVRALYNMMDTIKPSIINEIKHEILVTL
jgi:hypothetical protein